jgi:hypothetical protein
MIAKVSTAAIALVAVLILGGCTSERQAEPTVAGVAQDQPSHQATVGGTSGDSGERGGGDQSTVTPVASRPAATPTPEEIEEPSSGNFSFFVTSLSAMQTLSGSQDGFGGDLGGLEGADNICQKIAEGVGAGDKTWRAFLSATEGPDGEPVNAIDRVGNGPWYDANGRLVATSREGLQGARPDGDPQTINDLPDEYGVPLSAYGDSHDILTGSDSLGMLFSANPESTCNDWTSSDGSVGSNGGFGGPGHGSSETSVMCGHSWPRGGGGGDRRGRGPGMGMDSWLSSHAVPGCSPGVNLEQRGGGGSGDCVGCAGGYGAFYCLAVTP